MDLTSQPFQQLLAWTDSPSPSPFGRFSEHSFFSGIQEPIDGLPRVLPDASATGDSNSQVQRTPVQFDTAVDNLVRLIQAKPEILSSADTAVERAEPGQPEKKEDDETRDAQLLARGKAKRKRFACEIPGCNKMFTQKNNLDSHRRSHTGESPYQCPYCVRSFTQSVNLNSHINRHTGARPYVCPECPKTFPQPSNLKAHLKTHVKRTLRAYWICQFGNCQKAFTAKGNLKNHQNRYHVEEIEAFNAKLASMVDKSILSEKEKAMALYLAEVHNLANKGIKGRGKGHKVERVLLLHPPPHPPYPQQLQQQQSFPSTSPIGTTVYAAPYPMPLPNHHHNTAPQLPPIAHSSFYGLSNPATCSMNRPPPTAMLSGYVGPPLSLNTRDTAYAHHRHHGAYADQLSDASSVRELTPVLYICKEEHGQELAFGDRMF